MDMQGSVNSSQEEHYKSELSTEFNIWPTFTQNQ